MLDRKIVFIFYLAAVVCFLLAAFQGQTGRRGAALTRVGLVPLGLAFFVFPFMWDTGAAAF